ncbi:hypothetical protein [Microbacterium sp.]|uniref:DUF7718 family protein n=1 Tax=Microbacterium sp. TaxID=51671 RepID=UPI0039E29269
MVRRDQQPRRDEKRAQREVERALLTHGSYQPPPRGECRAKTWFQSIDDADTIRIYFRTWRKGSVLADFALSVEIADVNRWTIVARVDCTGGTCHLHPPEDLDRHEVLMLLNDAGDMRTAFTVAYERLAQISRMIRDTGRSDDE